MRGWCNLQSHAGKVVERAWYQRSKHIFPASRWEVMLIYRHILSVVLLIFDLRYSIPRGIMGSIQLRDVSCVWRYALIRASNFLIYTFLY